MRKLLTILMGLCFLPNISLAIEHMPPPLTSFK